MTIRHIPTTTCPELIWHAINIMEAFGCAKTQKNENATRGITRFELQMKQYKNNLNQIRLFF